MLDEMHLSFSDMLQQGEFPGDRPNLAIVKWEIHSCVKKEKMVHVVSCGTKLDNYQLTTPNEVS